MLIRNIKCTDLLTKLFTCCKESVEVSEIFKRIRVECKKFNNVMKAGDCKCLTRQGRAAIPSVWQSDAVHREPPQFCT